MDTLTAQSTERASVTSSKQIPVQAAYQVRNLGSAPAMRKVFRLLAAEDSMYKSGQVAALKALTVSDPWQMWGISRTYYIFRSIYGWVIALDEDLVDQLSCRVNGGK